MLETTIIKATNKPGVFNSTALLGADTIGITSTGLTTGAAVVVKVRTVSDDNVAGCIVATAAETVAVIVADGGEVSLVVFTGGVVLVLVADSSSLPMTRTCLVVGVFDTVFPLAMQAAHAHFPKEMYREGKYRYLSCLVFY